MIDKKDILFNIDMQLYNEFNDKFCEINDNLGTFYSYKDLDDLEKAEKEKERKLLRQAIKNQSQEIEYLNCIVKSDKDNYINKSDIKDLIKGLETLQKAFPNNEEVRIRIVAYKELLDFRRNK